MEADEPGLKPCHRERRRSRRERPDDRFRFDDVESVVYSHDNYGKRLISDATYPAPNPLSIFTTLTFDAQEFSIPSSAAIPLNDAP